MSAPASDGSKRRQLGASPMEPSSRTLPIVAAPTLELLVWIADRTRSYSETLEVWKTSCPRLAVWEDALADDLVRIDRGLVLLTAAGRELLATLGR